MVQDFNAHPLDSLHVVICCFEEMHAVVMEETWKRTCVGYLRENAGNQVSHTLVGTPRTPRQRLPPGLDTEWTHLDLEAKSSAKNREKKSKAKAKVKGKAKAKAKASNTREPMKRLKTQDNGGSTIKCNRTE